MPTVGEAEYLNLKWDYVYLIQRRDILEKLFWNLSQLPSTRRGLEAKQGAINSVNRTVVFLCNTEALPAEGRNSTVQHPSV